MKVNSYVREVCKVGQGGECCRYLVVSSRGLECAKLMHLRDIVDAMLRNNGIRDEAGNCPGQLGVIVDTRKKENTKGDENEPSRQN